MTSFWHKVLAFISEFTFLKAMINYQVSQNAVIQYCIWLSCTYLFLIHIFKIYIIIKCPTCRIHYIHLKVIHYWMPYNLSMSCIIFHEVLSLFPCHTLHMAHLSGREEQFNDIHNNMLICHVSYKGHWNNTF